MFTLFPHLPPELRDEIWYLALSEPRPPGICHWKKGCWIPKYLTPEEADWSDDDPNNIRLEFRYDKLATSVHIPIVDVNQEARRVALAWAGDNNIKNRYINGKYEFKRRMNKDRDTVYLPNNKIDAAEIEAIDRGFEPDLIDRNHTVATYITSLAVPARYMRTADETPYSWEWHENLEKIYVIVGKQPDGDDQWEIDTTRGTSLFWTRDTGKFIPQLGADEFCSRDLLKTIVEDKMELGAALMRCQGPAKNTFEIRVCSVIRREESTRPAQGLTLEKRLSRVEALLHTSTKPLIKPPAPTAVYPTGSCSSADNSSASRNLLKSLAVPGQSATLLHTVSRPSIAPPETGSSSSQSEGALRPRWKKMNEIPVLRLSEDRVAWLKEAISDDCSWQRVFIPMFSKPEVLLVVEAYLDEVNPIISLFDRRALLTRCDNEFPLDSDTWDPAWWACLNAIVGIAIQMKTLSSAFEAVGRISWSFFKNAFAVFPRLIQNTPTLMSIKALLSMAMFLSGTTDSKTMMLLLSSATKQFRMLSGLDSFQEPVVVEDKQWTISVAYLLEETCFSNCGFRLATSNSISEIQLPQKIEQQRTAGVDHGTTFWPRVELAIIESKAQKLLQKARRLLPFLLCCAITIYVHTIQHPHKESASSDLALITSLLHFIHTMKKEGCDLDQLLAVLVELERSASVDVTTYCAPAAAPMADNNDDSRMLLANPDYMPLVQGLMGNISTLREQSSNILSSLLGGLGKDPDGFVSVKPVSLNPSTYGF
ncbi:hypothetical protein FocTR4_00000312 [Fusarium oxysporum f. sp. cubense]|uniref:2EXR domain-containing protein n=2 Tax=Fusarium oxysporum species complex TaxID=171631 RepID=A0A5C6T3S0_FUSOC|nr:hypothetical protein FocTR4_00000312 [Fusarium oxysporum f. sp. cubense]